jgi:glycerol-1-phosphate dehydrogenase [NAD(P)+]
MSLLHWAELREQLAATPGLRPVGLRRVEVGIGALDRLGGVVADLALGRPGDLVVLRDDVPKSWRGADVHPVVTARLAPLGTVRELALTGQVHADEATTAAVVAGAAGAAVLITVGSGTLADLGKMAGAAHDIPHVVVQTAASVNGFADDQSVLMRSGVKRTVASGWPAALIADADLLVGAPLALNRAGVGDLLSMFTAPADWLLATELGFPNGYQDFAVELVRPHGDRLLAAAPGLAAADPDALTLLAELLTLSGISMGAAGATSPSSGMEHLISHLLEMLATAGGYPAASHGAQVGVGTLIAASLWDRVRSRLADGSTVDITLPDPDVARARVEAAFTRLDPSGATVAECWTAYSLKLQRLAAGRPRLRALLAGWAGFDERVGALLLPAARLVGALTELRAPTGFAGLRPEFTPEVARWAIGNAHLMRDRFTVADLADLIGAGGPDGVDAVLDGLAPMGAGL